MPALTPGSLIRHSKCRLVLIILVLISIVGALCGSRDFGTSAHQSLKQPVQVLEPEGATGKENAGSLAPAAKAQIIESFGRAPLAFEANQGQADHNVRFFARAGGYNLFLTETEAVFMLPVQRWSDLKAQTRPGGRELPNERADSNKYDLVRMTLAGSNPSPKIEGFEQVLSRSNYMIGDVQSQWTRDVTQYGRVQYDQVYPGISLAFYGNHRQVEYDFVVAPRADYRQIRLKYRGAGKKSIDTVTGDLILVTGSGQELRQQKPFIYQLVASERKRIHGGYRLNRKGEVEFQIGPYDRNLPLVIDPSFVFSTYFGGGADDIGYAVARDSSGNTYIAGRTFSTNIPVANAFRSTNSGLRDAFITKLNVTGSTILYSTYIGGSGDDLAFGLAVNASGEAYITGWTSSNNFPLVNALQPFYGGGSSDGFLVRLSAAGNSLVTSTYAGGSGTDVGTGIALDGSNNIYGIGFTDSLDLLTTNAIQPFNAGGADAFLLEVSASANSVIFATYAGGSGDDFGNGITVDSSGNIYAIGDTSSTDLTTVGALQSFNAGGFDAFLGKLSPSGTTILFATYAGGSGDDAGRGIALDSASNIYATGFTNSTNLSLIVNAIQPTKSAGYDAFVAKLNSNGSSVFYSTFLGGNNNDASYAIAVDNAGNCYLTGETFSTNFPQVGSLQASKSGVQDAFVTKINSSGSAILFSTYLGGSAVDAGEAVAADPSGNAYVTGVTFSTNFLTANAVRSTSAGGSDAFIAKIATVTAAPPVLQFSASTYPVSEGSAFATISVTRTGDTSAPATVKYATSDATDVNFICNPSTQGQTTGAASRKCDYHIASGRVRFAAGETSKPIILSLVNDVYVEGAENLTIALSSPTGGTLGSASTATVTITDNDTPGQANPIDNTSFYVRMLYVDLLSREPEPAGLAGWVHRIDFCGQPGEPPPPCDRVTVGGDGFLRSTEFFDREFFVIRLYRSGLGRILRYDDVGDLAYVSGFLTSGDLELNKQELISDIMARSEFSNIYNSLSNLQFVDTLIQTAGVFLPTSDKDAWVTALNGGTKTRAVVFREISERPEVSAKYLHEAQVVSCYYGFFTRNPDGAYFNYLQRLDSGEITLGDLANAFINAAEYRQRFGQ